MGTLSPSLLAGMQNGTATLEDSVAVSYKIKHTPSIWSRSFTLLVFIKELNTYVHKKLAHRCLLASLFITVKT